MDWSQESSTAWLIGSDSIMIRFASYLKYIVAWSDIGDVNPLTINIMTVGIPAAHSDPLFPHVVAGEALMETCDQDKHLSTLAVMYMM